MEQITNFLDKYIYDLRTHYNINIYPDLVDYKCNECDIENFKLAYYNNLKYEQIRLDLLGINAPYHRASLLGFNLESNIIWFIVDITYGQFFQDKQFEKYMFENYKDFTIDLLQKGYTLFTEENIISYINGFIFANPFLKPNCKNVYDKLNDLLSKNNIIENKTLTKNSY